MGDEKGKTGKPVAEQEEKPSLLPSAYDEDLMLRAAMYGVLFQAYADKASYYLHKCNERKMLLDTLARKCECSVITTMFTYTRIKEQKLF